MKNKKGFTLIELLAVIVILALLVAVAVPAVTRYLNTARKGTLASSANAAISAVRNDYLEKGYTGNKTYTLDDINGLLEKDLTTSPFNSSPYNENSKVSVTNASGVVTYTICLIDGNRTGLNGVAEANVDSDHVSIGLSTTCAD